MVYGYLHSDFKMAVDIPQCIMSHHIPESLFPSDRVIPKYYPDKNYAVHIPKKGDWHNNSVSLNDDIVCFTDGCFTSTS